MLRNPLAYFERVLQQRPADWVTRARMAASYYRLAAIADERGDGMEALRASQAGMAIAQEMARVFPSVRHIQRGLGQFHTQLGLLHQRVGHLDAAIADHEQARALREKLAGANPSVPAFQVDLAYSYGNLGSVHGQLGHRDQALQWHRRACDLWRQLVASYPTVVAHQSGLAYSYDAIAMLEQEAGQPAAALRSLQEARTLREQLVKAQLAVPQYQQELSLSHYRIGGLHEATGNRAEALRSFHEAKDISAQLVRAHPESVDYLADLALDYQHIGLLQERSAEALYYHQLARGLREQQLRLNPTLTGGQIELANALTSIGFWERATGRLAQARRSHQEALKLREQLARDNPGNWGFQQKLAYSYFNLGHVHERSGQSAEVLRCYGRAAELFEKLVRAAPAVTAYQDDLAWTYVRLGEESAWPTQPRSSILLESRGRAVWEKKRTDSSAAAPVAGDRDRWSAAFSYFQKACTIQERRARAEPGAPRLQGNLVLIYQDLAYLNEDAGRISEVIRYARLADDLLEQMSRVAPAKLLNDRLLIAYIYFHQGCMQRWTERLMESLLLSPDASPKALAGAARSGAVLRALNWFEQSQTILEEALRVEPDDVETRALLADALYQRGQALRRLGRCEEALSAHQLAVRHQRDVWARLPEVLRHRLNLGRKYADLARTQLEVGGAAEAAATAAALRQLRPEDPDDLYEAACELVRCAALVGQRGAGDADAERRQYGDQAMAALRQAVRCGFKDLESLKNDPDLDALRSRDDFRTLLAEAGGQSPGEASRRPASEDRTGDR